MARKSKGFSALSMDSSGDSKAPIPSSAPFFWGSKSHNPKKVGEHCKPMAEDTAPELVSVWTVFIGGGGILTSFTLAIIKELYPTTLPTWTPLYIWSFFFTGVLFWALANAARTTIDGKGKAVSALMYVMIFLSVLLIEIDKTTPHTMTRSAGWGLLLASAVVFLVCLFWRTPYRFDHFCNYAIYCTNFKEAGHRDATKFNAKPELYSNMLWGYTKPERPCGTDTAVDQILNPAGAMTQYEITNPLVFLGTFAPIMVGVIVMGIYEQDKSILPAWMISEAHARIGWVYSGLFFAGFMNMTRLTGQDTDARVSAYQNMFWSALSVGAWYWVLAVSLVLIAVDLNAPDAAIKQTGYFMLLGALYMKWIVQCFRAFYGYSAFAYEACLRPTDVKNVGGV